MSLFGEMWNETFYQGNDKHHISRDEAKRSYVTQLDMVYFNFKYISFVEKSMLYSSTLSERFLHIVLDT
jgi:hypothetical protein